MFQVDLKCSTTAVGPSYYRECLAKVGEIRQRPNRLVVGDRVSVCLEADVVRAMAQGHGGWQNSMADVSKTRIYPIAIQGPLSRTFGRLPFPKRPEHLFLVSPLHS